jgi:hypothetical protein
MPAPTIGRGRLVALLGIIAAFALFPASASASNASAYDNTSLPVSSYSAIANSGPWGFRFTATATGPLQSLAFIFINTGGGDSQPANIQLLSDNNGTLGSVLEALSGTVTATGGRAVPLTVFPSQASPTLTAGSSYWVLADANNYSWAVLTGPAAPNYAPDPNTGAPDYFSSSQLGLQVTVSTPATWTPLNNAPQSSAFGGQATLDTCELLTDGTVMCIETSTNTWHRLSPDIFGSYVNGSWDTPPISPMPNGTDSNLSPPCDGCPYAPTYFASAVLADGHVVVIGGEYLAGYPSPVNTNIGFLYDPFTDSWSGQLQEAFGSGNLGDISGMVMANGTFVVAEPGTTNMEELDEIMGAFTPLNPTGKIDPNDEENWDLLPDGTILAIDGHSPSTFEIYDPFANSWTSRSMPINVSDISTPTMTLGNSTEAGLPILRPDGTVLAISANATGQNAAYSLATATWTNTPLMNFPPAVVSGNSFAYAVKDGPAALLPNGNVLLMASPVDTKRGNYLSPSHFFELTSSNVLTQMPDAPAATNFPSYAGRMLLLPTGEVLLTGTDLAVYSDGGQPQDAWRPQIVYAQSAISPGSAATIAGFMFNGMSQGAHYGDDSQSSTNYPLVRITNGASGHVFYTTTFEHSQMGVVAPGSTKYVTTQFMVPTSTELGQSTLEVVANGIPSALFPINIIPPDPPPAVPALPASWGFVLFCTLAAAGLRAGRLIRGAGA